MLDDLEVKSLSSSNTILDVIKIAVKFRKPILYCVLFATISTLLVVLFLPNWYKSTVSVFPAEQSNLTKSLGSASSPLNTFSRFRRSFYGKYLSKSIGSIETDRCLAILKSKTVLLAVIQKYDLVHVYDITSYPIENTIKELLTNVEFKVVLEGNIFITVYDKDPIRAAAMANYFVEILNATNSKIIAESIQLNQQLIDEYYRNNFKSLTEARDSLKYLQKRFGIIALPEQTKAYIKTTAELSGQLMAEQVRVEAMRKTFSSDYPNVREVESRIEELQKEIANLKYGNYRTMAEMNIFTPFSNISDFSSEYFRKYYNVEVQYGFLHYITWLNGQAKIEEQRNTPAVVILEPALPAERKSKPFRSLIVLGGIFIGSSSALSLSIFCDHRIRRKKQIPRFSEQI